MKQINMGWGSTYFLDNYWKNNQIFTDRYEKPLEYKIGSDLILQLYIRHLHVKMKNAVVTDKHIVVAAGASQILLALMAVLAKRGHKSAWAKPPHFSRFPKLADIAKLEWVKEKQNDSVVIVTNPNNPDAAVSNSKSTILDLCYNWPQYTDNVKNYDHPIMVFSLSKATGHASTRIGWAIVSDKNLAKELEEYIEVSTGGLSIDSQIKAREVIKHQLSSKNTVFDYGKKVLKSRWAKIKKIKKLPFKVLNNSGMFMWVKTKKRVPIIEELVSHLKGSALGKTDDFIRLNIGCSESDFNSFYALLKEG